MLCPRARRRQALICVHARLRAAVGGAVQSRAPARSSHGRSRGGVTVRCLVHTPARRSPIGSRSISARPKRRIRIASPVLTAGLILERPQSSLRKERCDVAGVIDDTQVDDVFHQWQWNPAQRVEPAPPHAIVESASFSGKLSLPWRPRRGCRTSCTPKVAGPPTTSPFVWSFNFSRSGERNAENVLEIRDAATADGDGGEAARRPRPSPRMPNRGGGATRASAQRRASHPSASRPQPGAGTPPASWRPTASAAASVRRAARRSSAATAAPDVRRPHVVEALAESAPTPDERRARLCTLAGLPELKEAVVGSRCTP